MTIRSPGLLSSDNTAKWGLAPPCGSLGVLAMAFLARMRDRYSEWHPDGRGLIDDLGFPVSRTQLMSDSSATWVINLVWSSFHSDR